MSQHNDRFPSNFDAGGGDGFSNWDDPPSPNGEGDMFGDREPSPADFIEAIAESAGEDIDLISRAIVLKLLWDFVLYMGNVTPKARESMTAQIFDSAVAEVRRQWTKPEGHQPSEEDIKLSNDAIDRAAVSARERFTNAYNAQTATGDWLHRMRCAFSKGVLPRTS